VSELTFEAMNLFRYLVGLFEWGLGPSQVLYIHRTEQHKDPDNSYVPSKIRTHDPNVRVTQEHKLLRPRGHWNRLFMYLETGKYMLQI
jgi:hypothetical protein